MADQIVTDVKIQYETVAGLKQALKDARKELDLAHKSTVEWTNALEKVGSLQAQLKSVGVAIAQSTQQTATGLGNTTTASSNAAMALLNLNYVIRDSPYFFQNFALGVLAVGNNINPLIDSFARLREEAGSKSLSTFALLKQALVGGAGISIAFSVVVTAIQAFVFWMSRSKDETEGLADAFDSVLNKMLKIKDVGNQFGITPEQLSSKLSAIETAEGLYRDKVERITASPMSKGTQFAEYFVNIFASRKLTEEEERKLTAYEKVLEKLREMKEEVQAQYDISKILNDANVDRIEKEDKIKKIKEDQLKAVQSNAAIEQRMAEGTRTFARKGFYGGEEVNLRYGKRQAENKKAFGFGGMVEDLNLNLEMGKIAAQQLGDTLSQAFSSGTIKLNEFIQSLIIAISKMLILRTITSFLTGGIGGGASSVGATPSFAPSLGKNTASLVYVEGKIVADGSKFVADFNNFSNRYTNKVRLSKVGRT